MGHVPKTPLQTLTLSELICFFLSSIPECHFLPTVVSGHLNCKTLYKPWTSKSGKSIVVPLLRSELYLKTRRCPRTNIIGNTSPLGIGFGWRRIWPALQDIGSTPRLACSTSWRCLTAAARGFFFEVMARTQLAPGRARR